MKNITLITTIPLTEVDDYYPHVVWFLEPETVELLKQEGYHSIDTKTTLDDLSEEQFNIVYNHYLNNKNNIKVNIEKDDEDCTAITYFTKLDSTHLEIDLNWIKNNSTFKEDKAQEIAQTTLLYPCENNSHIGSFSNTNGFNYSIKNAPGIKELLNIHNPINIDLFNYKQILPNGTYYVGKLLEEEKKLEVYSFNIDTMPVVYGFVGGVGTDGGFGDYAPPIYGNLLAFNNQPIIVDSIDKAQEVVEKCDDYFDKDFYSKGEHDAYDGWFPFEIEKVIIPVFNNDVPETVSVEEACELIKNNCYNPVDY